MNNNAEVGSKIAVKLANLNAASDASSSSPRFQPTIISTIAEETRTENKSPVSDPHGQFSKYETGYENSIMGVII